MTRHDLAQLPDPWLTPLLSVEDAGALLFLSRRSAYRAAAAGDLPTVTIAGRRRVRVSDLYRIQRLPLPARPGDGPVIR